jgi:DNA-binding NarL/FixJ family response regulator
MTVIEKKVNVLNALRTNVLDDDKEMNDVLQDMFEMHHMPNVQFFTDSTAFLDVFDENIHLAIIDHDLKGSHLNGVQVMSILREMFPKCQIIFVSGTTDPSVLKSVLRLRPDGYVDKDEPNYLDRLVEVAGGRLSEIRKNLEFASTLEKFKTKR